MSFYSFQAGAAGAPTRLMLDGEIVSAGWAWSSDVDAQRFCRELQACQDVDVIINSPGGDVFAGAQIYSMLKAHKGRVVVKIAGIAASIASEIAMAGDEVLISPAGYLMIHQPWMSAVGDAAAFEKAAEQLKEVSQGIINAYKAKTGLEEDEIRELLDKETYMNAQSAIDMGFADGLWEEDRSQYQAAPAASMAGRDYGPKAILNRVLKNSEFGIRNLELQKELIPDDDGSQANAQAIADLHRKRLGLMARAMEE